LWAFLLFALRDTPQVSADAQTAPTSLNFLLKAIRRNYELPALAAVIVWGEGFRRACHGEPGRRRKHSMAVIRGHQL